MSLCSPSFRYLGIHDAHLDFDGCTIGIYVLDFGLTEESGSGGWTTPLMVLKSGDRSCFSRRCRLGQWLLGRFYPFQAWCASLCCRVIWGSSDVALQQCKLQATNHI